MRHYAYYSMLSMIGAYSLDSYEVHADLNLEDLQHFQEKPVEMKSAPRKSLISLLISFLSFNRL